MSLSCAPAALARVRSSSALSLNQYSDRVPSVPEVAEGVPRRHRGLRVATVVPRACKHGDVARLLGLELEIKRAPRVLVAGRGKLCALPRLALVGGDLHALERAFSDPRAAAHRNAGTGLEARARSRRGD